MSRYQGTKIVQDVIVTGEAVAVQVRPASTGMRALGALIDYGLLTVSLLLSILGVMTLLSPENAAQAASIIASVSAFWMLLVPMGVEFFSGGRSLGKLALGMQVNRDDGGPITFRHSLIRAVVALGEIWTLGGSVALVTAMINRRGKRLGDFLAGTYVVSLPERPPHPVLVMPPDLAQWAAGAQVSQMPDALAVSVNSFLNQSRTMLPAARAALAQSLAAQVEPLVSPPPPWGVDPERFLAAAMVVRRDFEYDLTLARDWRRHAKVRRIVSLPYQLDSVG